MIKEIGKVAAGMVLYNSDYSRLLLCLKGLTSQVDTIIVYDNSPEKMNTERILEIESAYNCKYIFSGENLGMPGAMNEIMQMAESEGYDWVLTMNADSVVPSDMIKEYRKYFHIEEIGMICPQVIDKRRKYMHADTTKKNAYIKMCITAAACTRVKAWRQVGGFDDWLFVDLLDNDISKRMILNGWKILQINSIVLDQEFGDIEAKNEKSEKFWIRVGEILHNDNFAKFSYKKIVHPNRVYYTCRNVLYLNKKFKEYGGIGYKENYNCNTFLGFILCFVIPSILRADRKIEVIVAIKNGFYDGKKKEKVTIPWQVNRIF
ncbi:glycosyltransferase [Butyrivibrio sp. AE2015]|uniref:glycosyltransferase n=1 Tax=Butyrivibrio sp. AE2015 TaxID=1280663 RepID=UPI0003B7890B|nr:glycosyltransferase [Butyrivibrio sp. AE2015]